MKKRTKGNGLVEFSWAVPRDGFSLSEETDERGTHQLLTTPEDSWWRARWYDPLREHTALFRELASVGPTAEAVLEFANKYGPLGITLGYPDGRTGRPGPPTWLGPEHLAVWRTQIADLKAAVEIWDLTRSSNRLAHLSRYFCWRETEEGAFIDFRMGKRSFTLFGPGEAARFTRGDLLGPAMKFLERRINEQLRGWVSPQLKDAPEKGHQLTFRLVPHNLIGAAWLQFAQAVMGNVEQRQCKVCGTWFAITPDTARRTKVFCSQTCKTRDFRARKAAAEPAKPKRKRARGK